MRGGGGNTEIGQEQSLAFIQLFLFPFIRLRTVGGGCTDRQASIYQTEIQKHPIFKPSPILLAWGTLVGKNRRFEH